MQTTSLDVDLHVSTHLKRPSVQQSRADLCVWKQAAGLWRKQHASAGVRASEALQTAAIAGAAHVFQGDTHTASVVLRVTGRCDVAACCQHIIHAVKYYNCTVVQCMLAALTMGAGAHVLRCPQHPLPASQLLAGT